MTSPLNPANLDQLTASVPSIRAMLDGRSVAIAQEWIGSRAGSEKVFEALAVLLPDATLHSLSHTPGVEVETGGRTIETSMLDRGSLRDRRSISLPLMPLAWRRMRRPVDVAITSAHAMARSFGASAGHHLSYVHSPARYLWFPDVDERSASRTSRALQSPARVVLKRNDLAATARTDSLAANSLTTQARIRQVYDRPSTLIYPPVDTEFYRPNVGAKRDGLLAVGRLVPYKRMDSAIEVAHRIGTRLTVAGNGPDAERLSDVARRLGADVDFVHDATDEDLRRLFRSSEALLFPGNEDFGIVPVEAQACGCPVVTSGVGGALESVVGGVTGVHAIGGDVEELVAGTSALLDMTISEDDCRAQAERFSYRTFGEAVAEWIASTLGTSTSP